VSVQVKALLVKVESEVELQLSLIVQSVYQKYGLNLEIIATEMISTNFTDLESQITTLYQYFNFPVMAAIEPYYVYIM